MRNTHNVPLRLGSSDLYSVHMSRLQHYFDYQYKESIDSRGERQIFLTLRVTAFIASFGSALTMALASLFLATPSAAARELSIGEVFDIATEYLYRYNKTVGYGSGPKFSIGLQGQKAQTDCTNTHVEGSYYCPKSNTILVEPVQIERLRQKFGDGAVLFVLTHEYAHYLQWQTNSVLANPYHELQADCIAGAILLSGETDAPSALGITQDDGYEMMATAYEVGGGDVHGSSTQRANALLTGARSGLKGCGISLQSNSPLIITQAPAPNTTSAGPAYIPPPAEDNTRVAYEQLKRKICDSTVANLSKPFDWKDASTYSRALYISQGSVSTGAKGSVRLYGCLPESTEGYAIEVNIPMQMALNPPEAQVSICTPGTEYSPLLCTQRIKAKIDQYISKTGKSRYLDIVSDRPISANSLFAIQISGIQPMTKGKYLIQLWINHAGLKKSYYVGTYVAAYK